MRVYFDNNIFIYLENGQLSLKEIENSIGGKIEFIFYSASHIQETLEITGKNAHERENRIRTRLDTITRITENRYLNENLDRQVIEYIESPFEVFKTITEVPFAQSMMRGMANFFTEESKRDIREQLNIDPKKMNNYHPNEVVDHLNQKLNQWGDNFTLIGMLEKSDSYFPSHYKFGLSNRIAGIFEFLDMLGYWRDKPTQFSNYARFWDSSHTFYAAHCDYFVSDDKRTRNKARVVYDIYEIGTKVISSDGKS